jgi:hypothetical protein
MDDSKPFTELRTKTEKQAFQQLINQNAMKGLANEKRADSHKPALTL